MKEKIIERITREIRADKALMSRIYVITLAAALLILAVCVRGPEQLGKIITDEDGRAVGIERHSTKTSESYDFEVIIEEGSEIIKKDVNLTIQALRKEGGGLGLTEEPSREDEIDAGLSGVVNEIEVLKKQENKTSGQSQRRNASYLEGKYEERLQLSCSYTGHIYSHACVCNKGRKQRDKEEDASRRRSILRSLPRFCNQLFLMMNAGMILSDAFESISDSYADRIASMDEACRIFRKRDC